MEGLIHFALLCTAIYYVVARAEISRAFWEPASRASPALSRLLACPACSGTWIGAVLGHLWPVYGHEHGLGACVSATFVHAAFGMVLTAMTFGLMKLAYDYAHIEEE